MASLVRIMRNDVELGALSSQVCVRNNTRYVLVDYVMVVSTLENVAKGTGAQTEMK